ncbi:cation:proton antiporter [Candidatus Woesearchaeota archaeon]|nr:cation:proton antiporter [Candidatus Woesearchaeota archaeon]
MDPMIVLTYIAIILLIGVLCTFVSKALRLPYHLILLLLGIFLGSLYMNGVPLFQVDASFIIGISTLLVVLLVFDSSSRIKIGENEMEGMPAINLISIFVLFSLIFSGLFAVKLFYPAVTLSAVLYSLVFAVLVVETDLGSVLHLFKDFAKEKAKHLLLFFETEANLNTAFVILFPFVILEILKNFDFENQSLYWVLTYNLPGFLYEILMAVGVGIIIGLLMLKILRKWYDHHFSPIALLAAALGAYIMASLMGGIGIVAVAVVGFFFGNIYVEGREQLAEFGRMLVSALEILVFVILGIAVRIPLDFSYFWKSILLFAVVLIVRIAAVFITQRSKEFTSREKLFIGLNMPKGIAIAAVVLLLSTYNVPGLNVVLQLSVLMMIYSIVLSFVLDFYAEPILREPIKASSGNGCVHSWMNVLEMNINVPKRKPLRKRPAKKKRVSKKKNVKAKKVVPKKKKAKASRKAPKLKRIVKRSSKKKAISEGKVKRSSRRKKKR